VAAVAEFKRLRELSFDRQSKKTGRPEQLRVQLMQVDDGAKFVTLTHFWRAESGEFFPPSKDTLRITIKRSEAVELIEVLREMLEDNGGTPPGGSAAQVGTPPRGGSPRPISSNDDGLAGFDPRRGRKMVACRQGKCVECSGGIEVGDLIGYDSEARRAAHEKCAEPPDRSPPTESVRRVGAGLLPAHGERGVDLYSASDASQGGHF
jgi:hypothetical protein